MTQIITNCLMFQSLFPSVYRECMMDLIVTKPKNSHNKQSALGLSEIILAVNHINPVYKLLESWAKKNSRYYNLIWTVQ